MSNHQEETKLMFNSEFNDLTEREQNNLLIFITEREEALKQRIKERLKGMKANNPYVCEHDSSSACYEADCEDPLKEIGYRSALTQAINIIEEV